jgi:uncharacterized protein
MPLFIKSHSYGEYVFDWSWADAYQRHGIDYYPKLINAIPFTPATGKRWAVNPAAEHNLVIEFMSSAVIEETKKLNASSCHVLFPCKKQSDLLIPPSWQQRTGYQYHWFNQNYRDFEDFLSAMSSRKRKNIYKERQKITQQQLSLFIKSGNEVTKEEWENFYFFYQSTYIKRSGHTGYLSIDFFLMLADTMPENLVMIQASTAPNNHAKTVAAALFFQDKETLYGRYWGCKENYDSLHFETCYYQGIDYAIKNGLQRFDPGAQGEHKIQRGFTPIKTHSNHWIANDDFSMAISRFLAIEKSEVEDYIVKARELLPFRSL